MNCKALLFVLACSMLPALGASAQESPTLRKIQETGIITIGFREKSIPFSYLDKQKRPIGYSIDLCSRIVEAVKAKLKLSSLEILYRPVTSANRIAFVVNDIVDLECGSTTNTLDRQKEVAFSVTTFVSAISMVSKKTADFQTLQQLGGHAVVSTVGTNAIDVLAEANRARKLDMRILAAIDHADSFGMIETDRAAAFVMDDVLLHGLVAGTKTPSDYVIHDSGLSVEPYAIIVRKNDPEFKKVADDAIVELFKSGEIAQIYRKWFLTPIPPNRILLQLPMGATLKRIFANPTDSGEPADYR